MNGVHDLGGMHGFGPVVPERDEAVFHAEWERRVLAVTLAVGALGLWNIDQNRHARESLPPATYLSSSYYRIWFLALERSLRTLGLLEADRQAPPAKSWPELKAGLDCGTPYARAARGAARFAVGDRVRTKNLNPVGHTRLPRYARAKVGTVARVHGCHVFPDRNAVALGHAGGDPAEWLYAVAFTGSEIWGEDADACLEVGVDAWEPYLEPA